MGGLHGSEELDKRLGALGPKRVSVSVGRDTARHKTIARRVRIHDVPGVENTQGASWRSEKSAAPSSAMTLDVVRTVESFNFW